MWCHGLALAALLSSVLAVDHGNFKTCSQSGFCKRHRDHKSAEPQYTVNLATVKVYDSKLSVHLVNKFTDVQLLLELSALQDKTARIRVTELESSKSRYEPPIGDVLVQEPKLDRLTVDSQTSDQIVISLQGGTAILQANPFRIDFFVDGEPVVIINDRSLLKYEQYRQPKGILGTVYSWLSKPFRAAEEKKEDVQEQEPEGEEGGEEPENVEVAADVDVEEPDMWEETFKTHKDTKPFGPSSIGMDVSFPGFQYAYGIPEHADTLALKSTKTTDPYRLYNLDVFEYELYNPMALYGSVPFMIAHNEKNTVGVFWLNAAETWVDITSNVADKGMFKKLVGFVTGDNEIPQVDSHWFSESGIIDLFVFMGPQPADIFQQYAALTGTTPLPPLFGLAYHQSRWNYNDEDDVASVNAGFDDANVPMDVIWLDIEHTDGKRYFTWDGVKFSHSEEMINNVSAMGRKMVTIVDPHLKRDGNYFVHKEATEKGLYVKNKDGNEYEGWCWPGSSSWPDFLDPEIREFWAHKFSLDEYKGSTMDLFTWNDMNEPSVFNGPEITMHKDAKHYGGWEHRDVHNIYGMYVHRSTYEGLIHRGDNKQRPFVLSRAFFAGSQRYGAIWTGDNTGEWGHLKISLPMVMSLNLVGITFSGADVGGFFKNPDNELLTRWYQAAAYQPFFRAHAHLDTRRREPWLQPPENLKAIREAVEARYRLLPYWYTLFYESERSGSPVMRPLWVDFPRERDTFGVDDQHMLGPALLVHPVTDAGASAVSVYLPGRGELWYDRDTWQQHVGGQVLQVNVDLYKIPVYQRGGFIVPQKNRIRRASSLMVHDPYTLVVTLDKQGQAKGGLYLDDFHSFRYQQGEFVHRQFVFENDKLSSINLHPGSTAWTTEAWVERVVVVGYPRQPSSIEISGPAIGTSKLDSTFNAETKTLTIRKPAVNIGQDFAITLD